MTASKSELYRDLTAQLAALLAGEADLIANAANAAALIYHGLPGINWAGFISARARSWCSVRSKANPPACGYP